MEEMKLILPDESYLEQVAEYRREFLENDSSMDGCGPLRRFEDMSEWLYQIRLYFQKETVPAGRVQATQFLYIRASDNKLVGMIQVRHEFNEYLEKYAGHIGYSVRPSERRKCYASSMLKEALKFCKEIGLERVLISCIETNEASRRTILKNGGVYESTVYEPTAGKTLQRYWIDLKKEGY